MPDHRRSRGRTAVREEADRLSRRPRSLLFETGMDGIATAMGTTGRRLRLAGTVLLAAGWLAVAPLSAPASEPRSFPSPELADRYRGLVEELRCLVCQNQTIADSNADLARDLRDKVDEMLRAGRSDEEILAYMVARYGNFVRYRPPFDAATALLWCGPFVLAAAALIWLLVRVRRRAPAGDGLTGEERTRLARLMEAEDGPEPTD